MYWSSVGEFQPKNRHANGGNNVFVATAAHREKEKIYELKEKLHNIPCHLLHKISDIFHGILYVLPFCRFPSYLYFSLFFLVVVSSSPEIIYICCRGKLFSLSLALSSFLFIAPILCNTTFSTLGYSLCSLSVSAFARTHKHTLTAQNTR